MSELDSPRIQPFSCPYCAEEDIVPWGTLDEPPGVFLCHSCERRFQLRYLGSGPGGRDDTGPGQEAATPWHSGTR